MLKKDGFIDTIEKDPKRIEIAKENIRLSDKKINLFEGDAKLIIKCINKKYDMIFIDANKSKYLEYLEYGLKLLNKDGIIFADNVLYKGYVKSNYNKHKQRTAVNHLREFLSKIQNDKNLKTEVLDIGDGLAIIRFNK